MNIAIIGAGGRSTAYLNIVKNNGVHRIAAICDNNPQRLNDYAASHLPELKPADIYVDYRILADRNDIDVFLICTPDTTHREIALALAGTGKALLLEKPVATTIDDTIAILDGLGDYPHSIYLGFVLRYTEFYSEIHKIVHSGGIGKIITVAATEMLDPRHSSSFYRRWHRYSANNGGLMNAKCSHDLDLLNWIIGSDPASVFASGGRSVFNHRNDVPERCLECPIRRDCVYAFNYAYYEQNFGTFHSLSDLCVYNSEKDIVDHECMIIKYENDVVAQFELCMFGHEESRRIRIHGTGGVLEGDFLRGIITISPFKGTAVIKKMYGSDGGHGGGDEALLNDMFNSIRDGKNTNHVRAGCLATLIALAGEESMRTGKQIKMDSWLKRSVKSSINAVKEQL